MTAADVDLVSVESKYENEGFSVELRGFVVLAYCDDDVYDYAARRREAATAVSTGRVLLIGIVVGYFLIVPSNDRAAEIAVVAVFSFFSEESAPSSLVRLAFCVVGMLFSNSEIAFTR